MKKTAIPLLQLESKTAFPIYVIEGIDGSGKSSVGSELASRIGGFFYERPKIFEPLMTAIDSNATLEARFFFYLSYNLQVSYELGLLAQRGPVICVRYVYSTIAYHMAKGLSFDWILSVVKNLALLKPSKVFFLDVSDREKQQQRICSRGVLPEDVRVLSIMDNIRTSYASLFDLIPSLYKIDTSDKTMEQVITEIQNEIG